MPTYEQSSAQNIKSVIGACQTDALSNNLSDNFQLQTPEWPPALTLQKRTDRQRGMCRLKFVPGHQQIRCQLIRLQQLCRHTAIISQEYLSPAAYYADSWPRQ